MRASSFCVKNVGGDRLLGLKKFCLILYSDNVYVGILVGIFIGIEPSFMEV